MPRSSVLLAALLVLHAMSFAQQPQPLARLAWIAGCWAADNAEPGSMEQWLTPAGGAMLGVSRTVRGGKMVEHEFMLIRADAAGAIEYVAMPSGQRPAAFALVRVTDTEAVFENLKHDFPQRVVYAQDGPGKLAARIEGAKGSGAVKAIAFPMTRVPCEPAPPIAGR